MTARQVFSVLLSLAPLVAGCSPRYEGASTVDELPSDVGFGPVVTPIDYNCGSLDCHGDKRRNLRLYGMQGLRFDPNDVPCGNPTTPDEVAADYRALSGLEPELLSAVVRDGGQHPERLTLIRKARGTEKHVGGVVFPEGSYGDQCLSAWIAGKTDELTADCNNAIPQNPRPLCIGN